VATPYLSEGGLAEFKRELGISRLRGTRWIVRWDRETAHQGSTSGKALLTLLKAGAEVRHLGNLHAKVYLRPTGGVVAYGSANLSKGGLRGNLEIVRVSTDAAEVRRVKAHYEDWWRTSRPLDEDQVWALLRLYQEQRDMAEQYDSWLRLATLGAYASLDWRLEGYKWTMTIPWVTLGLKRPSIAGGAIAPARLTALPKGVQDVITGVASRCKKSLKKDCIGDEDEMFLPVDRFVRFRQYLTDEEDRLNARLAKMPAKHWRDFKKHLRVDLLKWLTESERASHQNGDWIAAQVEHLLDRIADGWAARMHIRLELGLRLPHPAEMSPEQALDLTCLISKAESHLSQRTLKGTSQ
jgi:hypothetical protein